MVLCPPGQQELAGRTHGAAQLHQSSSLSPHKPTMQCFPSSSVSVCVSVQTGDQMSPDKVTREAFGFGDCCCAMQALFVCVFDSLFAS